MPAYSHEKNQYHVERVREVLTLNPRAGVRLIRDILQKDRSDPITLDVDYILKLKNKIKEERKHRFDFEKVGERLAQIADRTESVVAQMWSILLDPKTDPHGRVGAAKLILDSDHKLLEAQMAAGVYEKHLGTFRVKHTHQLSPDLQAQILSRLANYGIVKQANVIEQNPAGLPDPARDRIGAEKSTTPAGDR